MHYFNYSFPLAHLFSVSTKCHLPVHMNTVKCQIQIRDNTADTEQQQRETGVAVWQRTSVVSRVTAEAQWQGMTSTW
jgi:hypothetical protein